MSALAPSDFEVAVLVALPDGMTADITHVASRSGYDVIFHRGRSRTRAFINASLNADAVASVVAQVCDGLREVRS